MLRREGWEVKTARTNVILAILASLLPTATSALESSISALESSISALESSVAAIERSLPFWEYFGFGGALLVVVGVLLELEDVRHRHNEDWTAWAFSYFGVSQSFHRPRFFKKYGVELASIILVAGGVAMEFGAGLMIESKNASVRAIDTRLRSKSSELRNKSDQLVALLNDRAAELKALIQPRDLSVEQQKTIATELKNFSGRRVLIWVYTDPEAMRLGQVIKDTLKGADISSDLVPRTDTIEFPSLGVAVSGDDKAFVTALRASLLSKDRLEPFQKSASSNSSNVLMGGMKSFVVVPKGVTVAAGILIGLKPLPQLKAYEAYVRSERKISDEQVKVIRKVVGSSIDGHTLTIQANPDDSDIWPFANRIAFSFGMMKAQATVWPQGWIVSDGLTFSVGKNRQKDFDLMVKALDAAGVDNAARLKKQSDHKGVSDDDLILTIGAR